MALRSGSITVLDGRNSLRNSGPGASALTRNPYEHPPLGRGLPKRLEAGEDCSSSSRVCALVTQLEYSRKQSCVLS